MITWIFIAVFGIASYSVFQKPYLAQKFTFNPYAVAQRGEYYRFISSGFIHADWGHLIFNLFTFYFFGQNVETIYRYTYGTVTGGAIYIALLITGIIAADLPSFFRYRNQPAYNSLGASGGVSAVLFVSIMYFPLEKICIWGILCLPGFILGVLYLVYSAYADKKRGSNINHSAHFVGAAYGILFAILLDPGVFVRFFQQLANYRIFD
jgi:membrane associated rhomboid family serine protease